jgi:zinc protease
MIRQLVLLIALLAVGCASKAPKAPTAGAPAQAFHVRPYEVQKLNNGLTIMWIADQQLPYVGFQMLIKSGSAADPAGKEGLAAFTGHLLEKGTKKRSATRIANDLEQIGSGFEIGIEPDYSIAASSSLSFNRDQALNEFSEILLQPSFPAKEIERQRELVLASLQKIADRPQSFAEYQLPRFMYGQHPYGHESAGTSGSVKKLKAADVQKFYADNYVPGNAVLAVVGQFDDAFKKAVADKFGQWKSKKVSVNMIPAFPSWEGTDVLLIDRDDLNQAQIEIAFKGVPRNIPDYMELRAALKILGESMGSRLFDEIREKRGLTYHINAWFDPRLQTGPMGIYTFTRTDKINETVEETLKSYRNFVAHGVTDAEVEQVKALIKGQFPRIFETPEALAHQLLLLDLYKIPGDFLTNYLANADALTKGSINAAVKKYFDPNNLKILVYAPRAKAEASLRKLGKVEVKPYREFLR